MKRKMLLILMVMLAIAGKLSSPHAAEELAPVPHSMRDKQGPEFFVQLAKESIIYFSGLKFMQEV